MNIKQEILLRANESVVIKEEPPKPRKKKAKKKKIVEKVKLKSLLDDLLLEAVDLADGSKVIRALERGQIPGVKKKVFLNTSFSKEQIEETLNNVIGIVSNKVSEREKNKYLFLIFKRAGNIEWLDQFSDDELNEIVDSMMAYFGNINKKEVKENEEVKKKFEEYESSRLSFEDDKKFEQWANEKFAHKAKSKDQDIDVVYDDGEWTVHIPKTFAAASKLACMADRKAHWCTAANNNMFKHYTNNGKNPLFIIRNENKNIMFQMDWGRTEINKPNFMDERDYPAKLKQVLSIGIPNNVWKAIKNKDGESVYDKLEPIINKNKDKKTPLDDTNKTPEEELNGWNETVFITVQDFMNEIKSKSIPNIFKSDSDRMRDVLDGTYSEEGEESSGGAKRIAKYTKGREVYYHIVPVSSFSLDVRTDDKAAIVLKDESNTLRYLSTNDLLKTDLPNFFTDTPLDNTEKTDGDMEGWNEYIYQSAGEFLREISGYQMPKVIGNPRTMTSMVKGSEVGQIGKVSKGKKVYYYLIAKPEREITLKNLSDYGYSISGSKSFERIALQLSGNKLSFKTAKSIAGSDLPGPLKEKLFTRYKKRKVALNPETRTYEPTGEIKKQSIPAESLKKASKSEMPIVAFEESGVKLYTNVNTFTKIMNIPSIGEKTADKIKRQIMGGDLKPADVVAAINKKIGNKKVLIMVMNNANVRLYSNDDFFDGKSSYLFKRASQVSYGMRNWILTNLLPNILSAEDKKILEKINNKKPIDPMEPIHKFKGGEELVYSYYGAPGVKVNGEVYYRYENKNNIEYLANFNTKRLPQDKVEELEKQGAKELIRKVEKLSPVNL